MNFTLLDTPVGELGLVASDLGLCQILWPHQVQGVDGMAQRLDSNQYLVQAKAQLLEYFSGQRKAFGVALDVQGSPFQLRVWQSLQRIPYGETRNYSWQAEDMGSPKAVRAVGSANGKNPLSIIVPCHRCIRKDGTLGGFGGGLDVKTWLLNHEQTHYLP